MVAGRCVAAPGEVVVTGARADAGLATNATAFVVAAKFVGGGPGLPGMWVQAGDPCPLAVVGVYRPRDPTDPYWGRSRRGPGPGRAPSRCSPTGARSPPATTSRRPRRSSPTRSRTRSAWTGSTRCAPRSPPPGSGPGAGCSPAPTSTASSPPSTATARTVALIPRTAAVPLLALCWFVLFLAIANTAQARRTELGMVKLRGVSTGRPVGHHGGPEPHPGAGRWGRRLPGRAPGRLGVRAGRLRPGVTVPLTIRALAVRGRRAGRRGAWRRRSPLAGICAATRDRPAAPGAVPGRRLGRPRAGRPARRRGGRGRGPAARRGSDRRAAPSGVALLAPALGLLALGLASGARARSDRRLGRCPGCPHWTDRVRRWPPCTSAGGTPAPGWSRSWWWRSGC